MNLNYRSNTSPTKAIRRPMGSFSIPSHLRSMLEIQETADQFETLIQNKQYQEASSLLADDFYFETPAHTYRGRKDWLKNFPRAHKDMPAMSFGEFEVSARNSIERRGSKNVAFINIAVKQVVEVNDEGKIKKIVASTA